MYSRTSNCFLTGAEHKPAKLILYLICPLTTWQESPNVAEEIEAEL